MALLPLGLGFSCLSSDFSLPRSCPQLLCRCFSDPLAVFSLTIFSVRQDVFTMCVRGRRRPSSGSVGTAVMGSAGRPTHPALCCHGVTQALHWQGGRGGERDGRGARGLRSLLSSWVGWERDVLPMFWWMGRGPSSLRSVLQGSSSVHCLYTQLWSVLWLCPLSVLCPGCCCQVPPSSLCYLCSLCAHIPSCAGHFWPPLNTQ